MNFVDEIYEKALELLGGNISEGRVCSLKAMCEAAAAELEARLRSGVTAGEIKSAFVIAAGVLALSMYVQLGGDPDVASFRAGNVSVSHCDPGSRAASSVALRHQAEELLTAYLADRGFEFTGVQG